MRTCASGLNGRLFTRALMSVVALSGLASMASAQTTVTINQPATQVVWATVRGGTHANTNDQTVLATRAADNLEYNRRALLKFDTENAIPKGTPIASALLTVTVKTGSGDATRTVGAFQTTTSWTETEVTWNQRRNSDPWMTAGGDLGSKLDQATVSNIAGAKVTFDVTPLVQAAVAGDLGSSRYTRIALVDLDESTSESYREYAMPDDTSASARPTLTVTLGSTTAPTPAPSSGSTTTLRVLHWNTHHGGVRTDGVWDPDLLTTWIAKLNPDLVSLNEMERFTGWCHNTDEPATIAAMMKQKTGKTWYYKYVTTNGASSGIGEMVLSRFPLDASEVRLLSYDRSIVDIAVTVNGRTINLSSTHLDDASSTYRKTEIGELLSWERGLAEQRIVAGDFNSSYTSGEYKLMTADYKDSWAVAQAAGTAVAYPGNTAGNTRNGRIDYIYYSHGASDLVLKSSQVFDTRDANGVMPSDHRPLLSVFTVK